MRSKNMLLKALGVEGCVMLDCRWEDGTGGRPCMVFCVRVVRRERHRCPRCGRRGSGYDQGDGVRRWRVPDVGLSEALIEANAPRMQCKEHGVLVARVPWARSSSGFSRAFEDTVAWLAVRTDKSAIGELLGVAWRTVGAILERVLREQRTLIDPFANVIKIGIDEISYRKHHKYLTVVVNHETGRLIWAAPGRNSATLHTFFDALGPERSAKIQLVSADAASWIAAVVTGRCPKATQTMDPFHVVQWATNALDECRRDIVNDLRQKGELARAKAFKNSMWALRKNPENMCEKQQNTLANLERENQPLYRAYLLKETLRQTFQLAPVAAKSQLDDWLRWAPRSKLAPFIKLAATIRAHRRRIEAAFETGLSNARVEGTNTRLRLLTRVAFGFHSAEPLLTLALLKLGGMCPALPHKRYPLLCQ